MLTKLAGMGNAGWLCSMPSESFWKMKYIIFQGCPTKLPFCLGSLFHIISSLFSCFRSWDYPEHFGIYFQPDRKSKTWFFVFLNVYVSWIKRGKMLISQLSPPKFRCFAGQNRPKGDPIENEFWQFSNAKMRFGNT